MKSSNKKIMIIILVALLLIGVAIGERALCQCEEFEAIAWCAKEALYKLAQIEGLDFRRDIIIEAIDLAAGTIVGRAGELQSVTMQILRPDKEHVAVATL